VEQTIDPGFVEGSNATFLLPAAGGERGPPPWAPIVATGWTAATRGSCDGTVARDEREQPMDKVTEQT
jgi:hypothetical protein